jgi:glutaredoxin
MKKSLYAFILLFFAFQLTLTAQDRPIKIVDERVNNRLMIYAINENEHDLDVSIKIEGAGFRQRVGTPRLHRVPKASKINIASLVVERGRVPVYTYELTVKDSLSRRVVRKPATQVKIDPRKNILVYLKEGCSTCDSLVSKLDKSYYKFRTMNLEEKPEVKEFLIRTFKYTKTPYDSISNPIVSLGGTLYSEIEDYDQLLNKLNSDGSETEENEEEKTEEQKN